MEESNWIDPNRRTRPGFCFHFRPPHHQRKVPTKPKDSADHFTGLVAVGKRPEDHRSKPWIFAELPPRFGAFSPPQFGAFSPEWGRANTWVFFLTLPFAISNHPQPRGNWLVVNQPLKDSRLWKLNTEPSPRVGGHHHHRWTQLT